MLSQSPGIYILLGAALSSVSLLISNYINNKFQLDRERQQKIWQVEIERQKYYREKIYDSYMKTIQILTEIMLEQFKTEIKSLCDSRYNEYLDINHLVTLKKLYFEYTSECTILFVGHPYKYTKEFNELIDEVLSPSMDEDPFLARIAITTMMENDPRIKDVNKEYLNIENTPTPLNQDIT